MSCFHCPLLFSILLIPFLVYSNFLVFPFFFAFFLYLPLLILFPSASFQNSTSHSYISCSLLSSTSLSSSFKFPISCKVSKATLLQTFESVCLPFFVLVFVVTSCQSVLINVPSSSIASPFPFLYFVGFVNFNDQI